MSDGEVRPKVWAEIWRQFLSLSTLCWAISRKDKEAGETKTGASSSGATLGLTLCLKSLRSVGNTLNFAPDRPQNHRDEETGLPGRPWRGLWSLGRTWGSAQRQRGSGVVSPPN